MRNKMLKIFLITLIVFASTLSFAQGVISGGDGGVGTVCETTEFQPNSSASLELLDLYEARQYMYHSRKQSSSSENYALMTYKALTCRMLESKKRFFETYFGKSNELNQAFTEACHLNLSFVDDL